MIMMMGKYVRGRVWCINCPRFHASYQFQIPCQGFISKSSVLTSYQWQHTISWRPKINDSPKIMIQLLATIKRYCNYRWMSELLYWLLPNVECCRKMPLLINKCWYCKVHFCVFTTIFDFTSSNAIALIFTSWYSGMCYFAFHHLCFLRN